MKKILLTASLLFFATQASAWVTKQFVPNNVSLINVIIGDQANDGCWTNIGEVKRYAEDKLELAGFKVSKEKFQIYLNNDHFILDILVVANRLGTNCYGSVSYDINKHINHGKLVGIFSVGQFNGNFTGYENVNQYILKKIGKFMKEVEDPQW